MLDGDLLTVLDEALQTEALALALGSSDAVVILDDALAGQVAATVGVRFTGTLGLLLDAKRAGLITAVAPVLDNAAGQGSRCGLGR